MDDLNDILDNEDIEIDMSPMIDMVFLLLIFFVVASAIVDKKVPVDVPEAYYAKVPEDETGRFLISVDREGIIYVGQDAVTIDELKERLRPELEFNPDVRIQIRSDRLTRHEVNEEIMTACADVGATDLIFSAFEL
jgi:biopolymer transport protein ExbD